MEAGRRRFNQQLAGRLINIAKALATDSAPGVAMRPSKKEHRRCPMFFNQSQKSYHQDAGSILTVADRASERSYLFTSESVSEGHPDKLADRISDTVLGRFLRSDPLAKVACETIITEGLVVIAGEFHTTNPELFAAVRDEIPSLVREIIIDTGYNETFPGINPHSCEIRLRLNGQSGDIRQGVDLDEDIIGAGDQGVAFGHATDETPELMPLPIVLAHKLVQLQADLRKSGAISWLKPDAKSQVTVRYLDNRPATVETVVLSTQHDIDIDLDTIRAVVEDRIINAVIPVHLRGPNYRVLINPTGRFVVGGPKGDTGLTGRKIIVDTYGGHCPHGGGAFSGKDPSKVDRSAAYAARYVAKNIVAAGLAQRCTVQIAYAIGVAEPVSLMIDTHSTGAVPEEVIESAVPEIFDLTPAGLIQTLNLRRPIYAKTAVYGHFGHDRPGNVPGNESIVLISCVAAVMNTFPRRWRHECKWIRCSCWRYHGKPLSRAWCF